MTISKYAVFLQIKENIWYVYNNLLFEPVCLNDDEVNILKNHQFDKLKSDEIVLLKNKGVLIEDISKDNEVFNVVKSFVCSEVESGISLIYIIPCNICNLACKYCFIGALDDKETVIMSENTIINIVTKFTKYFKEKAINKVEVVFYGAEPLMEFKTIQKIVNEFDSVTDILFNYSIVTNGTLLSENIINWLIDKKVSIGISIDGYQEINDSNRVYKKGNNSVYNTVIEKIDLIKDKKIDFGLSITLTPLILENTERYLEWLKNLGIKNINFNLLHYTKPTDEWKTYYIEASKFLFKAYDYLFPYGVVDDRLQRKIRAFNSRYFKYNDCGAVGGNQICIAPNGDITVCHGYWHSDMERCGNINVNSISEVVNHNNFQKWKNNLTINKEECLECPAIHICGGGCAMQSGTIFNSQFELDKGFCLHTMHTLKELFIRTLD